MQRRASTREERHLHGGDFGGTGRLETYAAVRNNRANDWSTNDDVDDAVLLSSLSPRLEPTERRGRECHHHQNSFSGRLVAENRIQYKNNARSLYIVFHESVGHHTSTNTSKNVEVQKDS